MRNAPFTACRPISFQALCVLYLDLASGNGPWENNPFIVQVLEQLPTAGPFETGRQFTFNPASGPIYYIILFFVYKTACEKKQQDAGWLRKAWLPFFGCVHSCTGMIS